MIFKGGVPALATWGPLPDKPQATRTASAICANRRQLPKPPKNHPGVRSRKHLVRFISEGIMEQPAVKLENVHLSLGHGAARVHILKGVTLNIARGETVGLTGPSGSGK